MSSVESGWKCDTPEAYCPRCGTSCGPFEADGSGCPSCRDKRLGWNRCVRLGSYEGELRKAILAAKYTAWRATCRELGGDLGLATARLLRETRTNTDHAVICPVGTSFRRRMGRGIDHTLVLAREVGRQTGAPVVRGLTRRHRPPQQGLSTGGRRRNASGSFRVRRSACRRLGGCTVLLVDDVRTTGATLSAASRAIRRGVQGAGGSVGEIWAVILAVTPRPRR